ncbi:MAG: type II toxin-antitoxin system RelE/ParE family toxin [Candidatus Omnitrophota bacterium]
MESFEIQWKASAEKELRRINRPQIPSLVAAIESLSKNPFPLKSSKLKGVKSIYRVPVGDYRIVYAVEIEECKIVVYHVRHRKDVYRRI